LLTGCLLEMLLRENDVLPNMLKRQLSGTERALEKKPEGEMLLYNVERIRKNAAPILAKITELFSDYTIHDIRHSEQVVGILGWLIPEDLLNKMNSYELFFLVTASYLHDIGMADIPELNDATLAKINDPEKRREYIRKNHHLRSEQFVKAQYQNLGIEDVHQARFIGRICRGHREKITGDLYRNNDMYTSKNISINLPMLSMLLQVADDLDLTFERSPKIIFKLMQPKDEISKQEWERHLATCGIGIDPENSLRIRITATCQDERIHRSLKRLEVRLQEKLDTLSDLLFQYKEYSKFLPQRIIVQIKKEGYEVIDAKFSLQQREITTLLMGERLYDRKEAALRELLQNSYDACRLRAAIDKDVKPKISFKLTADRRELIVKDNGVGMTRHQIENYLMRIGKSFYTSEEFLEENVGFTPVSTFGIGILSCFMISNGIKIQTRSKDNEPLLIEINGIDDYSSIKTGNQTDIGTEVILFLKEDCARTLDLEKEIRFYARHLDFPISIILPNSQQVEVSATTTNNCFIFPELDWSKFDIRTVKVKNKEYAATVSFLCQKDDKGRFIPLQNRWELRNGFRSKVMVSIEGIFVNEMSFLLPPYLENFVFIDLNLKRTTVDISVQRTSIVSNNKLTKLTYLLQKTVLDLFRKWGKECKSQFDDNWKLRNSLIESYIFYSRYGSYQQEKPPRELREFIRDFYGFKLFSKEGQRYFSYRELFNDDMTVTVLANAPLWGADTYANDLMLNCHSVGSEELYLLTNWADYSLPQICDPEGEVFESWKYFYDIIGKKSVKTPLKKAFPSSWRLVQFTNLDSERLFEQISSHTLGEVTLLNASNRFVALILKYPEIVLSNPDRVAALESFFLKFKTAVRNNFQLTIQRQKQILDWYIAAGVIEKADDFILTKKQLPYYYQLESKKHRSSLSS